jgi:hypothetical protein
MKHTLIIAVCLLTVTACTKKSSSSSSAPTGAASTFNITFNGKTYHESTATVITNVIAVTTTTNTLSVPPRFICELAVITKNIKCTPIADKADISTAIGTYKVSGGWVAPINFIDYGDGGKQYSNDTNSTITVTMSTGSEIKGTFNFILHYNGGNYPATGDFDYKK